MELGVIGLKKSCLTSLGLIVTLPTSILNDSSLPEETEEADTLLSFSDWGFPATVDTS